MTDYDHFKHTIGGIPGLYVFPSLSSVGRGTAKTETDKITSDEIILPTPCL
jgi:hypothetical protein